MGGLSGHEESEEAVAYAGTNPPELAISYLASVSGGSFDSLVRFWS